MGNPEKIRALKARVASDPFNNVLWEQLLGEISRGRKTEEQTSQLREVYEDILSKFPTAASYWKEYCELEIDAGSPDTVKTLFSRCLLTCLDIDLWRTYLRFIRRLNDPRGAEGLAEVRQAYEFALDRIGQDVRSGPIWQEYITFLSNPKVGSTEHGALFGAAAEGQEDSARVAALRRAYHRALAVPTGALDALWQGYERFENSTGNKTLAKRALDEWRPRFQGARGLVKERGTRVERLDLRSLPVPPGRGGPRRAQQAAAWRDYLEWERSDPQQLGPAGVRPRVELAYEQALAILLLYPDVWLDFAAWHATGGGGGPAATKEVLHRARGTLPGVPALHFAAAEAEEKLGAMGAAREVYEGLVAKMTAEGAAAAQPRPPPVAAPAPAEVKVEAAGGTIEGAAPPPKAPEKAGDEQEAKEEDVSAGDHRQKADAKAKQPDEPMADAPSSQPPAEPGSQPEKAPSQDPEPSPPPQPSLSPQAGTLVWIQYMRFARRVDGMMAARKLFLRARKWPQLRWEAFAASAAMEWAAEGKEQIPRNIFELGLKTFLSEPDYVLQYASFLQGLGDTVNVRSLFERAFTATPADASAPLYDAYMRYEAMVGSLATLTGLEERRRAALGDAAKSALDAAHVASLKYECLGLWSGVDGPSAAAATAAEEPSAAFSGPPPSQQHQMMGREEEGRGVDQERSRRPPPRRRDRSRSGSPPGRGGGGDHRGSRPPVDPSEPIRHFPRELAQLLNQLPLVPDGPVPDVQRVIDVILRMDFSAEGVEAHEGAAARERRRQRIASQGGPPGGGGGPGGGGPGFGGPGGSGMKRKAGGPPQPAAAMGYSDSEGGSSDDEGDGGTGADVYRRRMRARV